ncbi:hypothetical protein ACLRDI_07245 [Pseudomonas piscis]|uniref:hypothetical protein n=1 Tax=Pseudomonas piscis TaxID=2614538 RepID=UPI0039A4003D
MLDPQSFPSAIAFAFEAVGGIGAAARICGRSCQALNKWRLAAALPRTDYTGETEYASLLARAAKQKGIFFDSAWLLDQSAPRRNMQGESF